MVDRSQAPLCLGVPVRSLIGYPLEAASPDAKPMELPAGWTNVLWLAPGVGMVQSLNKYAHMYQLAEATLK